MKYRAQLVDSGAKEERPSQIMSNSLADIRTWAYGDESEGPEAARGVLSKAPSKDAKVLVFAIEERQIATWNKSSVPEGKTE